MAVVLLTWLEVRLRPVLLVWRVGVFLAFTANGNLLWILYAMLAAYASALEVAGVNLNTWLVGVHLKEDAGNRRVE